ncbi:MAG: prolipoprotein diacylglyceryl transferase, partial [Clostridia bacterium]|nr:prolipoprotein diacylglyceryl transferase [Clostridia bacterium]
MYPYLEVFGLQLPTYGLTAVVAALAGIVLVWSRYKAFGLDVKKDEWASVTTYIIVGVLIGSKILYL